MTALYRHEVIDDHLIIWNCNGAMRNALSPSYYAGVMSGLARASQESAICAVILAGENGFFCSGGDLNTLQKRREMSQAERSTQIENLHDIVRCIRACPKPVIAAVEGGAAGAGLSIALACDMIVAAEDAAFTLAYVKAGLVPDGGATHALMQALPRAAVSRMAMLGHPMSASRFYEFGLVSDLVVAGAAVPRAQELAQEIARGPECAIATIKALMNTAETGSLDEQLNAERDAMAAALGGDEALAGISAFLAKQRPVFRKKG